MCFVIIKCLNMVTGFGVFVFSFKMLVFQKHVILCTKVKYLKKNHLQVDFIFLVMYYMVVLSLLCHHVCL